MLREGFKRRQVEADYKTGVCSTYFDLAGVKEVAPYIILVVILMIKPYGLFGTKEIERV